MSKLDRYLISEGVLDLFPHLSALCLDRHLSDHRPILMRETNYDYGPSPFRFFHSWFAMEGFNSFVETTWKSLNIVEPNGLIRLKKKLQALKIAIKAWSKEANKRSNDRKINIQQNLSEVDKLIDQGKSNDEILIKRITLLNDLQELNNRNAMEISQKAKIRWSIEGDENTKYFHGIMNKKRSQLAIRGTLANGEWISEPHRVKNEFFTHFKKQFSPIQAPSICFDFTFPTRLSSDQVQDLERPVTYEEVKRAVWDCGTNKSPGPDGFSFEFYRKYWTTIDDDVFQAVRDFFVNGNFPRGCNSSFIALIPKIQDAKFVKDFRPISLIGSVYKIIAKILANRLCLVLPYLISDVQSAFVANRQILDGPFILNELLSWCKFKKLNGMIFKVDFEKAFDFVKLDYLDETLKAFGFGLKWRLKINLHKSKLIGIGVSSNVVAAAASLIGCSILTAPFNYLGVKVGSNMSRINTWDDVISKVPIGMLNHLESIRPNFFYEVDGSDRKLAWIRRNMVLTSKKNGGLGEVAEKMGHPSLSHSFRRMPRGGVKQENYGLLCSKVADLVLQNISDRWCWSLEGSQEFSVKSFRILIDNTILPETEVPTRWLRVVPIKEDRGFEVEPIRSCDMGDGSHVIHTQDLIDYQFAHNIEQYYLCDNFHVNGCNERRYGYSGWYMSAMILGKAVTITTYIIGSMHKGELYAVVGGSLLGNHGEEKKSKGSCIYEFVSDDYPVVYTRLDMAYVDVCVLDEFDRGLQTDAQVFVDCDCAIGRSITVMGRSVIRYEIRLHEC
ncbi:RNA-directed DNA polymerase, eukaryota [Tanacetum coccineum]